MKRNQILKELLEAPEIRSRVGIDENRLLQALTDVGHFLDFDSMSEDQLSDFISSMRMFTDERKVTNTKPFEKKVSKAIDTLKELMNATGPGFYLYEADRVIPELIDRLEFSLVQHQDSAKKAGRPAALSWTQALSVERIADALEKSKFKPEIASRWSTYRIRELGVVGQFAYSTSRSDETFNANPSRLISNLCYSVGVKLREASIENSITTFGLQRQALQKSINERGPRKKFPSPLDFYDMPDDSGGD